MAFETGLSITRKGFPVTVAESVAVTGTVTTGGLTDTQLRAEPIPVLQDQPADFLLASGTRNATTGDGTAVIAADATKKVEYHLVKVQRIDATGDQAVIWKSGATVLDTDFIRLNSNQSGVVLDLDGKVKGGVNEAQYFHTATAVTFDYWILYRLV